MRSKIVLGLVLLILNCSVSFANGTFSAGGRSIEGTGPHTPTNPDSRD